MWLPKEKYFAKLKDPKWQKRRLQILERDKFTCQMCGDDTKTLHVHHRFYLSDRELWEYNNNCFITLCEDCHAYETSRMPEVIAELNGILKYYFMADNIEILTKTIHNFKVDGDGNFKVRLINFALSDMKDYITKKFIKSLTQKGEKNGKA